MHLNGNYSSMSSVETLLSFFSHFFPFDTQTQVEQTDDMILSLHFRNKSGYSMFFFSEITNHMKIPSNKDDSSLP